MENQWFNTFVYAKIEKNVDIVTAMVIVSALVTTISTFIFGTLSDRLGKRKIFVCQKFSLKIVEKKNPLESWLIKYPK